MSSWKIRNSWEGKTSDLFAEITKIAEERNIKKEWPKSASTFGKKLKKLSHNLEEVGILIKDGRDGKARRISITKSTDATENKTTSFSPTGKSIAGSPVIPVIPSVNNNTNSIEMTGTQNAPVTVPVTCCHNGSTEGLIPSHGSVLTNAPPIPEEVQGWKDDIQELFCILSIAHQDEGMCEEQADSLAIEQVKKSEWFVRWNLRVGNA